MEFIVEPHVAASILDQFQSKAQCKNCKGWLIGTTSPNAATITNFIPDSFSFPVNTPNQSVTEKELKAYSSNLLAWLDGIKAMYPREGTIIGWYSVGNGESVKYTYKNQNGLYDMDVAYDTWSTQFVSNGYFAKRGDSFHLDIRVPAVGRPTLDFNGSRYVYAKGSIPTKSSLAVRIVPESAAASTVAEHVARLVYGEDLEATAVPVLELDRIIATQESDVKVSSRIQQVFQSLEDAVAAAKPGDSVSKLVASLREESAASAAATGESLSESRTRNALMVKLTITRLQEYLQVLEQTMVRGAPRGRFDKR